jgi:hypothetical protein
MTKAQIDKLVADAVAKAVQDTLASVKQAPAAKVYQAEMFMKGEKLTVPEGHVALLVPVLTTEKQTGKGLRYIAETRGVALHQATGKGVKFGFWATEAE